LAWRNPDRRVRAARQSGVDAGVPESLRDSGVAGCHGRNRTAARKIPLAAPVTTTTKFVQFMPVRTEVDDWGRDWAVPRSTNGSGDFTSLAGTDGFVELPAGPNTYPKGFVARLFRW
jgi:molybdopterin biosynthesis enzyme